MAEFVEISTEKTIDSLDQLIHIGLLSDKEAKNVIKSRQNYEYKLARQTKREADYTSYIQFEINFLEMIRMRRQKSRIFNRGQIDFDLINRIHNLFTSATNRFQNNIELWMAHIEFAKKHRQSNMAGRIYKRMLQIHARRFDLWMDAAEWEIKLNQPDAARKVFLTGLRFNEKERNLWIAYQRFEIQQSVLAKKQAAEKKTETEKSDIEAVEKAKMIEYPEAVTDGRLAVLAFRKALEANPGDDLLCVKLIEIWRECASHDVAEERVGDIFGMVELNEEHPEIVAAYCRSPMIGILPGLELESVRESISRFSAKIDEDGKLSRSDKFISLLIKFIIENINKVAPKSKSKESPNPERAFFLSKIKFAVESASEKEIKLDENVLADSIELLDFEGYSISSSTVKFAVKSYPSSKRLWLSLFCSFFGNDSNPPEATYLPSVVESFSTRFPETIDGLHDALSVWRGAIQLCILLRLPAARLDKVWSQGLQLHAAELGPGYIEWAYHTCSLGPTPWKSAEKAFGNIADVVTKRPLPISVHTTRLNFAISTLDMCTRYAEVEECGGNIEVEALTVRNIFDEVLRDVGTAHLDVWLLFTRFENTYGDLESLTHVAWRARNALPPKLAGEYNTAYTAITSISCETAQSPIHIVTKLRKFVDIQ